MMTKLSFWNGNEGLWYFIVPSSKDHEGGMDGHYEVLCSPTNPNSGRWNTDTIMVALCLDQKIAERIAELLARPIQRNSHETCLH
jgi:hypothetical protein